MFFMLDDFAHENERCLTCMIRNCAGCISFVEALNKCGLVSNVV